MNQNHLYVIILAGGGGTRFAPISTEARPKQFLSIITSDKTMLEATYLRALHLVDSQYIFISTHRDYKSLVLEQIPSLNEKNIITEPIRKNTAPAIAYISYFIYCSDPKAVLLFMPSDQYIHDLKLALQIFKEAANFVSENNILLTFGVSPTYASTEYGYIHREKEIRKNIYDVKEFKEKPDEKTAKAYLDSGLYSWNAGIFCWQANFFLKEIAYYAPQIQEALSVFTLRQFSEDNLKFFFNLSPSISIDYALMEKSKKVSMFSFNVGWSDVGTWDGLKKLQKTYQLNLPPQIEDYLKLHG
ncbi:MAG: hypothetical protein A3G32_04510 [Deltaproteobacteria bacterium RIFCSPLOWO2_12_FULL_40_28]|nr:MAG: hypothetical protein A3C45_08620 [Deltaproteobacteria bacterium RIFCSPHIGHO2_02_FULL_40_28]OGQ19633.1 MAG: hypothetical protein A3E27_07815 [Deltaproteobacteria bacterium RIFCSPHIGHO2_12_FULL_40_32]OGQ40910.1 MAG: hypothetical protein A3I69_03230 [Deltaproteobacteria bacterium RIFCSPLOWO2_02_FULL_40_36]OGQ54025.1 MAG: hypothetical protein A3G32_04510 [Deltaproteobacteria bacterium RIFCSPLOWO2_12_FULL_40_28]